MTERSSNVLVSVLAAVVVVQIGLLLGRPSSRGTIVGRAVNAGVPLGAGDGKVLVYRTGRRDELVAETRLGQAAAVPPGRYDLRVLYTRSREQPERWVRDVGVDARERIERQVEFLSGELRVEATVGSGRRPGETVVVYVFRAADHDNVVTSMAAGERTVIGAGTYDLRVVLVHGTEERAVHWLRDMPVRPGLSTEQSVSFRRGLLHVTALNGGRELPAGAVTLSVYRAGDSQMDAVAQGAAGASLDLEAGRYDVRATFEGSHDRPERWLRNVSIAENDTARRTVEFPSGTMLVRAAIAGGEELEPFQVYVYYYREGDHEQAVAYASAGQPVVLAAGRYDLRAHFFRSHDRPDSWRRGVEVRAGHTTTEVIRFASGKLLIRAYDPRGRELVGDNVFVSVYPAGARTRPLVVARSGEELTLTEGTYDVRASDSRDPTAERWTTGVRVTSARRVERAVAFASRPRRHTGSPQGR